MKKIIGIIVVGVAVIIAYDTLSSLISVSTGIPYGLFSFGSLLIYVLFGFLVARNSKWFLGAGAGAIMGLFESTVGWAISWYIGPGKSTIEMNGLLIAATIIFVVMFSSVFGLVGGLGSLLLKRNA